MTSKYTPRDKDMSSKLILNYRNVAAAIRTCERLAERIYEATRWNVTILLGGPQPRHGGQVQAIE